MNYIELISGHVIYTLIEACLHDIIHQYGTTRDPQTENVRALAPVLYLQ